MNIADIIPAPAKTANPAPLRPTGTIRRTCSLDVCWPEGFTGHRLFDGTSRDIYTPDSDLPPSILDEAKLTTTLGQDRTILSIQATPAPTHLHNVVGQKAGNHLRMFLQETMPELQEKGSPLYLALDDLSGTALVSNWGIVQWDLAYMQAMEARMSDEDRAKYSNRTNVCWGFQPGFSSHDEHPTEDSLGAAPAGELRNPLDPDGWHAFPQHTGASFRRARRIDIIPKDSVFHIDAGFQDSALSQAGERQAIHEYRIRARIDAKTYEILSLRPEPRILPFRECPGAVANTQKLVGTNAKDLRQTIVEHFRGPAGCTHLNDALRALADVPILLAKQKKATQMLFQNNATTL